MAALLRVQGAGERVGGEKGQLIWWGRRRAPGQQDTRRVLERALGALRGKEVKGGRSSLLQPFGEGDFNMVLLRGVWDRQPSVEELAPCAARALCSGLLPASAACSLSA